MDSAKGWYEGTRWWDELIDFSKNFDYFRGIDDIQAGNIVKKLKKLDLDLDLKHQDLNLFLNLFLNPDSNISAIFNRLCWNYVVGEDLDDEKKEQLKYNDNKKVKFPTYKNLECLLKDFCANYNQYNGKLKKLKEIKVNRQVPINFSNKAIQYIGFVFPNKVTCSGNLKNVDFRYSIFLEEVHFSHTTFSRKADFKGAIFSQDANFINAKFSGPADFSGAIFSQTAFFYNTKFSEIVDFQGAKFCGHSYFNNSKFERRADFQEVTFCKRVPEFFDATLKEDTSFFEVQWPEKAKDKKEANMQARAYGCLALIMEGLKRKEDKLFFFTKKMVLQRLLEKGFIYKAFNCFYEETSNYGNSLTRSFCYFVGTGILFGYFYYLMIYLCSSCLFAKVNYSFEAFKISFSNMLFFSSLLGLKDKNGYLERSECVTELIELNIYFRYSGIFQIFLSAIFLFLLLLTLRNKSRIF